MDESQFINWNPFPWLDGKIVGKIDESGEYDPFMTEEEKEEDYHFGIYLKQVLYEMKRGISKVKEDELFEPLEAYLDDDENEGGQPCAMKLP